MNNTNYLDTTAKTPLIKLVTYGILIRFMNSLRVAYFLASRSILRSSIWSTGLIVIIMTLTFLNLVVVSGILTGLVAGLSQQIRTYYSSDIIIEPQSQRDYIVGSTDIIRSLEKHPDVVAFSPRYIGKGTLTANYTRSVRANEKRDTVSAEVVGIDPYLEDNLAGISALIAEGDFLEPNDFSMVVLGSDLLDRYMREDPQIDNGSLEDVYVGDKIRLTINGHSLLVTVKGVLDSKVDQVSRRIYMPENHVRKLLGNTDLNRSEIAIKLTPNVTASVIKQDLLNQGFGDKNSIKTWQESLGTFFDEISSTFNTLGNFVGSIGLFIASVTVFIIIFVNALNRRKYIGIMKAIGINKAVIILSYIFQSLFYALNGTVLGIAILFLGLVPYFNANPIDFPFSDGILATTVSGAFVRALLLIILSLISAYIPARIIANQNTIDAILDR